LSSTPLCIAIFYGLQQRSIAALRHWGHVARGRRRTRDERRSKQAQQQVLRMVRARKRAYGMTVLVLLVVYVMHSLPIAASRTLVLVQLTFLVYKIFGKSWRCLLLLALLYADDATCPWPWLVCWPSKRGGTETETEQNQQQLQSATISYCRYCYCYCYCCSWQYFS